jgi:thioredoxin reductase
MSAGLYLKQLGLHPVVIEAERAFGGMQRTSNYANPFLLGHFGKTANELATLFEAHLAQEQIERLHARVTGLEATEQGVLVATAERNLPFAAAIVCFGTRWRSLDVPGAAEALGSRTLRYMGHGSDVHDAKGQRVVVIGGGDNAFGIAAEAATHAKSVTVLSRSEPRAQPLIAASAKRPNVEVRVGQTVERFEPQRIILNTGATLFFDLAYLALGFVPNTDALAAWLPRLECDAEGYLKTDLHGRTSAPRVWAAGDICNPTHPCVATAIGQGAAAAQDVERVLRDQVLSENGVKLVSTSK